MTLIHRNPVMIDQRTGPRRAERGTLRCRHMTSGTAASEVRYDVEGAVARITIDREARRNAMSFTVIEGLLDAFRRAGADDAVRVVVLTGAGEKAFCAGADLGGIADNASFAEV